MKNTTIVSVSIKPELLERLRALSEKESRNLSNLVSVLLEEALKNKAA
jgi:metal-responsive CopG/Arc/MetJ family transcriptional regulator